jgi:hypothetical protein
MIVFREVKRTDSSRFIQPVDRGSGPDAEDMRGRATARARIIVDGGARGE